jgi:fibro-slime domain-containing protein
MYGFEEFDIRKGSNRRCAENAPDFGGLSVVTTDRDGICVSNGIYHSCDKGGVSLTYGEYGSNCPGKRGYMQGPDMVDGCSGYLWAQQVYVTRDMVRKTLDYSQCKPEDWIEGDTEAIRGLYCARPMPAAGARCYGENLQDWFTDGGMAKRIDDDALVLYRVNQNHYMVNYDYNTMTDWGAGYTTRGFFPLDKYEKEPSKTYGRQNYYGWCDGGPCTSGEDREKHNYGFTMAGSFEFKWDATMNDMFKFIGDDDMWIFIDGKLFEDEETGAHADLGGNHLAAPAVIDIQRYARQKGWLNGTVHAINFFYVERQTDGSNLMLQMSLSDLPPPRFGPPVIQKAETVKESDGSDYTRIYLNTKIDLAHIKRFIGSGQYPIVIHKSGETTILAYKLESIEYVKSEGSMQVYIIRGQVCSSNGVCGGNLYLSSGDSLSFNVLQDDLSRGEDGDAGYWIDNGFGLPNESWYIRADGNASNVAKTKVWALNTTGLSRFGPNSAECENL